ncbi:uncharacterized protein IL334_004980 [Kwoniella shivajii]|uniref:Uncharacterized protein n=1 Tax=Kwoniella shivajii TaxID=564305 RepID=A0ABZ1D1W0_9TREE|nr:hypothetical protein IL334_004980 [Kwoniella shivajii]
MCRDFDPAYKLSVITAAFMSFLVHHQALSDPNIQPGILEAAAIARSAPQALIDANTFEHMISNGSGWNRACWTIWGGSYGGAERGGLEKESISWGEQPPLQSGGDESDDNGWTVEPTIDPRPSALSRDKAPWTAEEKWRAQRPRSDDGLDEDEAESPPLPLDQEQATVAEPEEIVLWVESRGFNQQPALADRLIGAGLRGRWGLMGLKDGSSHGQWWAFKVKDFILPAFWRGSGSTSTA